MLSDTALIGAFGTLIAFCALFVSYWQATTAHRKTILDLFERRTSVYLDLQAVVDPIMRDAKADMSQHAAMNRIVASAQFLFGKDLNGYIADLRKSVNYLIAHPMPPDPDTENRNKVITTFYDHLRKISEFYVEFPRLCEPYMKLDQRMDDGPLGWLRRMWSRRAG